MDNDKELFDLLNVMSHEISSKFDAIHFEINSMKSAISTLNEKVQANTKLFESLSSSINALNTVHNVKDKDYYKDYIHLLNSIQKELNNANNNILSSNNSSNTKLSSISEDLMFITHKILQSEKDLFKIQEKLKEKEKKKK